MSLRDKRQKEFADTWIKKGKNGILNLCPRFGKIYTTINILESIIPKSIIIAYPDTKIKDAWKADFEKRGYDDSNVTYTTHVSLKKYVEKQFDLIVIDEIHLLSEAQIDSLKEMLDNHKFFAKTKGYFLGLTGTLSKWTEKDLKQKLGISVLATYPIEQAIDEGVIVDYQITVLTVPLDNTKKQKYKDKVRTEKQQFDSYSWIINDLERRNKNTMFLRLARMRIIQNSIAKRDKTKQLLARFSDERILVFCGVISIAESLGISSHHSKVKDSESEFQDFCDGKTNHLSVVKIGNTGVTYKSLNKVIINYFDSNAENLAQKINRCMAMEYNNPEKKAKIFIISTDEEVEQRWLSKALEFFDKSKIKFIKSKVYETGNN
jgi:superfamily II DNA or RNA helicase